MWSGWHETCIVCIKNNEIDKILGCFTYGYRIPYNGINAAKAHTWGDAILVPTACSGAATQQFKNNLTIVALVNYKENVDVQ